MITIVVGCKNRFPHLSQVLQTWIPCQKVKEIIVVDWGSEPSLESKLHPSVRVLRVQSEKKCIPWLLPSCLNFGSRFVTTPQLLKLDADYLLHEYFLDHHVLQPGTFFRGNYKQARNPNEKHLNGALLCWTSDFREVGGYNEYLQTYGYDDTDLYTRLESQLRLRPLDFNYDYITHLPHPDESRLASSSSKKVNIQLHIITNMFLSKKLPWTSQLFEETRKIFSEQKLEGKGGSNNDTDTPLFTLNIDRLPVVTPDTKRQCVLLAKRCILHDHFHITWSMTQGKDEDFIEQVFEDREKPKFILRTLNGLGNRLRTLACGAIIARKLGALLLVEWLADVHCQAKIQDLFHCPRLLASGESLFASSETGDLFNVFAEGIEWTYSL